VLVGDFGPIAGAGVRDLLAEQGLRPIGEEGAEDVLAQVADVYPDAVVVDMDGADFTATTGALTRRYPGVTVIACSAERPTMRVTPAWGGEPYGAILSGAVLARAVRSDR